MTAPTPYYDKDGITIYCGDNVETLTSFADGCIDLIVTSPPYDNLRTYGGHQWGWSEFIQLAPELFRVTKQGGPVVWIVGDATVEGSETCTSFRQALYFRECGFRLHDTMIYKKVGSSPNVHHPRYGHCFEYMFVLSRGVPSTWNPHKKRKNATAGKRDTPQVKTQRNGVKKRRSIPATEHAQKNRWNATFGNTSQVHGILTRAQVVIPHISPNH